MKLLILTLIVFPFLSFAQSKVPASATEKTMVLQALSKPDNVAAISLYSALSSLDHMSSLERSQPEVYKLSASNYQVVIRYHSWGPKPGLIVDVEDVYITGGKAWVHSYRIEGFTLIKPAPGVGRGTR